MFETWFARQGKEGTERSPSKTGLHIPGEYSVRSMSRLHSSTAPVDVAEPGFGHRCVISTVYIHAYIPTYIPPLDWRLTWWFFNLPVTSCHISPQIWSLNGGLCARSLLGPGMKARRLLQPPLYRATRWPRWLLCLGSMQKSLRSGWRENIGGIVKDKRTKTMLSEPKAINFE